MKFIKAFLLLISILAIALIALNCSGGTINPVNPNDNNGDEDEDEYQPPPWNNSPTAWVGYLPNYRNFIQGDEVFFDGSESVDPDEDIVTYEWDFDYDDVNFDIDATGPTVTHSMQSFGSVIAALRVKDDGVPVKEDIMRTRVLVQPRGEISTVTNGMVEHPMLRRVVESQNDFYALYSGTYNSQANSFVQRSSDGGVTWGDPVPISTNTADMDQWGIWMDSAPFGIVIGWMTNTGTIRYSAGEPDGVDSISFTTPINVGSTSIGYPKPIFYTIACDWDGNYVYFLYLTVDSYSLHCIRAGLTGTVIGTPEDFVVRDDNEERFKISGCSAASGPTGRVYVVYSWKSLGYDNEDSMLVQYLDPSSSFFSDIIRADVSLDGFIYNHDPYVVVNEDNEPIVIFRTTGIYMGGKDVAMCVSDGDPPVFRTTMRGNNTLNGDTLAAQNSPSIAIDRDYGHVWLAFEDFRNKSKISQVYLTLFDNQYSTLLPDFDISWDFANVFSDINPQVCINQGSPKYLVVLWDQNGTDVVAYHATYN